MRSRTLLTRRWLHPSLVPVATLLALLVCGSVAMAAEESTNASTASADAKAQPSKPAIKKLTGAELYSIHCARCHAERYPTERTAAQWKTILLHMRVRANLPAQQSRTMLEYLQENSGR